MKIIKTNETFIKKGLMEYKITKIDETEKAIEFKMERKIIRIGSVSSYVVWIPKSGIKVINENLYEFEEWAKEKLPFNVWANGIGPDVQIWNELGQQL